MIMHFSFLHLFLFKKIIVFTLLFWLCWVTVAAGFSPVVMSTDYSLVLVHGCLIAVAAFVVEHEL